MKISTNYSAPSTIFPTAYVATGAGNSLYDVGQPTHTENTSHLEAASGKIALTQLIASSPLVTLQSIMLKCEERVAYFLWATVGIGRYERVLSASPLPLIQAVNETSNYVFISYSSKDSAIVSAVKQAFDDLPLQPYFLEDRPGGQAPTREIAEKVTKARALFVFFTPNSILWGETREWIVFEIGVAVAYGRDVFSWKQDNLSGAQMPRFLEQASRYRGFNVYGESAIALTRDIRAAAKSL